LGIFKKISENSKWIAKESESPLLLNAKTYVSHEKLVKDKATETRDLLKLKTDMNIRILESAQNQKDSLVINRNNRFLGFIKKDFYLKEASNIVHDMVVDPSVSKLNSKYDIEKKDN
jgi:hypothetical protein